MSITPPESEAFQLGLSDMQISVWYIIRICKKVKTRNNNSKTGFFKHNDKIENEKIDQMRSVDKKLKKKNKKSKKKDK